MQQLGPALVLLAVSTSLCACSRKDPNRKETMPVTGEVYVDGTPATGVQVALHDVNGVDASDPTFSTAITKEGGSFAFSTYDEGDGVPAGDYSVTFTWGDFDTLSMSYRGDKLKGRYGDPKKSTFQLSVKSGTPSDMGRIELKTK